MRNTLLAVACVAFLFFTPIASAQNQDIKFIADTLVIQAEGTYQAEPDLATVTFDISAQDKELKPTYDQAAASMQGIVNLAQKNGLKQEDISSGVLTVRPYYEGDRKKRARSYVVHGEITLRVRDFSKLGPILEGSVEDGITDFRSLNYSLENEEAAKQKAVAAAMKSAVGRANAALAEKGQKPGALRFVNVDVHQIVAMAQMTGYTQAEYGSIPSAMLAREKMPALPPPPVPQPEKVSVSATVQCAFQIQ